MKTKTMKISAVLAMLLIMPVVGHAASTWNMDTAPNPDACLSGCDTASVSAGNNATFAGTGSGAPTMTVSAFSTAETDSTSATTFSTAKLKNWGSAGWGVMGGTESNTNGPHAMDNAYGTDLVLLEFGSKSVALTTVKVGWNGDDNWDTGPYDDSDISVLAYTKKNADGSAAIPASIGDSSIAQLLANGWSLISHYADVGSSSTPATNTVSVNSGKISSSWWIVSAYNSAYYTSATASVGATASLSDTVKDSVKLLAVAGDVSNPPPPGLTPEPAGIALVGLGLFGLMVSRRRAAK